MQALKALVIIMGVLIVVGTTVVVVTIYNRMNRLGSTPAPAESATPAETADVKLPEFGDIRVPLPEPCRVVEMVPAGERLLLRLGSVARCNRILVLDLATGRQLGSVDLSPQE